LSGTLMLIYINVKICPRKRNIKMQNWNSDDKFLFGDQPYSKLIIFTYLIKREPFSRNF
jgi:hypothetical protein